MRYWQRGSVLPWHEISPDTYFCLLEMSGDAAKSGFFPEGFALAETNDDQPPPDDCPPPRPRQPMDVKEYIRAKSENMLRLWSELAASAPTSGYDVGDYFDDDEDSDE